MSLKTLLSPVVGELPEIIPDHEIAVLQEIPNETLFFALKRADSDIVQWTLENARPEQLQGIVDMDCWLGDEFKPERFIKLFHSISRCPPLKVQEYMKELDPEVIVRSLMEFVDVIDFDPENPPAVLEQNLVLSLDNKYALILKEKDPNLRESLIHWLNKLSATDLDLLRRHLESCKWEQKSEIEEFAYNIKRGRLEDMGFVDRHEAQSIYSRGEAKTLKSYLLSNPLEKNAKKQAADVEITQDGSFLPEAIREPLSEAEFLGKAIQKIDDKKLREVILAESLRCINIAIVADDMLHESVDSIKFTAGRARRYLDLGLYFISDADLEKATSCLETQPLKEIMRLGWLMIRELVNAAGVLRKNYPENFFGLSDSFLIQKLQGRHPELFKNELSAIGVENEDFVSLEAISKAAERLAVLGSVARFYTEKLEAQFDFSSDPLEAHESLYSRLLTSFVRQSCGLEFSSKAITPLEWVQISSTFKRDAIDLLVESFSKQFPELARSHVDLRLMDLLEDLDEYLKKSKDLPQPKLFGALRIASQGSTESERPQANA